MPTPHWILGCHCITEQPHKKALLQMTPRVEQQHNKTEYSAKKTSKAVKVIQATGLDLTTRWPFWAAFIQ